MTCTARTTLILTALGALLAVAVPLADARPPASRATTPASRATPLLFWQAALQQPAEPEELPPPRPLLDEPSLSPLDGPAYDAGPQRPWQTFQKYPLDSVQKSPPPSSKYVPGAPACTCPPDRRIRYWNHPLCRKSCCKGTLPVPTVLVAKDPCCPCGCEVSVPVCLPVCCTGEPTVTASRDLLGRGILVCRWCCGFTVKLVFRCQGDLTVHYFAL